MLSRSAHNILVRLAALLAGIMLCVAAPAARADALDGVLEVRSAYVSVEQGVFLLYARVAYPVNDDIRAALKDGLTLTSSGGWPRSVRQWSHRVWWRDVRRYLTLPCRRCVCIPRAARADT